MGESIVEFMRRQQRKAERLARDAEAAAHEAYGNAIRAGQDLKLESPGDVVRHGAQILQDAETRTRKAIARSTRDAKALANEALARAGQSPVLRSAAGDAAKVVGNVAGVLRGGAHTVEGLADAALFAQRLTDPLDLVRSGPAEWAPVQLVRGAANLERRGADYVKKGISDPQSVVTDARSVAGQWRRDLDPSATPPAPTFKGELQRNFEIAQNQGELAFDVGSLLVGGPGAKAVTGLERLSNVGNVEKYLAQGFSHKGAEHLATLYPASNMGSHFIPRRTRLPDFLGGGPLPKSFSDGVFNVLKPEGMSRGDLYELHYKVDPQFYGTKVIRGEGWSGKRLGLERHGPLGRLWHGSPPPLKARAAGLGASAGTAIYLSDDQEARP
ncbi:hypothetical protein [Phenylobacterium aquaticum]|uniref:hypothetical protein n=1 Tax=Phenylobacterium aquaticum TaxID=1763816 RepID=UPI0026E941FC|nr:hypothetical protein [Phenylobacterium aquaticum]